MSASRHEWAGDFPKARTEDDCLAADDPPPHFMAHSCSHSLHTLQSTTEKVSAAYKVPSRRIDNSTRKLPDGGKEGHHLHGH